MCGPGVIAQLSTSQKRSHELLFSPGQEVSVVKCESGYGGLQVLKVSGRPGCGLAAD